MCLPPHSHVFDTPTTNDNVVSSTNFIHSHVPMNDWGVVVQYGNIKERQREAETRILEEETPTRNYRAWGLIAGQF